ncbi:hypothetical protein PV516_19430 [Streptomyces scabiei]|uniref:hypothetical protein n=1 Tax=Streptomyces scabiei TaxID=1930 RepID=UPI0029B222FF|nr:hypothetical protein [Streptomyces scabiei]MDX3165962.1 hypothetical protein [Streptomyces scabiei]
MAAIAPERTIKKLPTERNLADLTAAQQELHWTFMGLLGYEGGAATDDGGIDDKLERLTIAQEAAKNAGITLPETAEIAECNDCNLIFSADDAREIEGLTLCGDHAHAWALANDENYGRPDTTLFDD